MGWKLAPYGIEYILINLVKIRPLWDGNYKRLKKIILFKNMLKSDHCGMETCNKSYIKVSVIVMLKSDHCGMET